MSNRILRLDLSLPSTVPAEAEARVAVFPERLTPATEVRGRLMGPRCPFASTVEVAYPFRPLPPRAALGPAGALTARAAIPEASPWSPEAPFLYEGPVELWQDGQRCDRSTVRVGLRWLNLGARGLRVNGRPLRLRGRAVAACTDEEALALRRAGHNLLLVPAAGAEVVCEVADRIGLFVLARAPDALALAALARHPSFLGGLVPAGPDWPDAPPGTLRGRECDSPPPAPLPPDAFPACGPEVPLAPGAPTLLLGPRPEPVPEGAIILGQVE
jgi:hypothetical protein